MVKIKICGLRRLEDIEIVNKYKPDYIGFVFADSKRKVSYELASQMKNNLSSDIVSVGVFVDAPQDEILDLYNRKIIEVAQLHGSESEDYINNLKENTNNELGIIVIVYMQQEGRGIGLMNKLAAYKLQEEGYDTVDANLCLGFKADERDYGCGAQMLRYLGVHKMRLMTNNPVKRVGLEGYGLEIIENIPIEVTPNKYNLRYLKTKQDRMGHNLHL